MPDDSEPIRDADPTAMAPETRGGAGRAGSYRLLQKIGEGGMGEVWEAVQEKPVRRRVALKLIKPGMDSEEVIARFESERQALALMDHPAIAKVLDAGTDDRGRPFFAMEFVPGIRVTDYCDRHRLTVRQRLELFVQICQGAQHAHQKAIIHRDLKPSNILVVDQDGRPAPKIIDFGVAKATAQTLTERTLFTQLGQLVGTPAYMSPEQAELTGADIDIRTDVYSLGMVLYELLAGALPFDVRELRGKGLAELRRRIADDEPERPSTRVSGLGETLVSTAERRRTTAQALVKTLRGDLDWIVVKALEKDRNRRYETAHALAQDVTRYLTDEAVQARPPSAAYQATKFVRRHRLAVTAAAVMAVALVAGILLATVGLARARRAELQARQEAETVSEVSEFLVGIFDLADPGEARGNTVTARELLDRGAERVREQLTDQPRVKARLMTTMGRVYTNLGLYEEANTLLEEAATAFRDLGSDSRLELATALYLLGVVHDAHGDYSAAEETLGESLQIREEVLGSDHLEVAVTLNSLGVVHWGRGDYDQAERLLARSLAIKRQSLGADDPALSSSLTNLGVLYRTQKKFAEAEPLFQQALAITEKSLGGDHPDLAADLNNLGALYEDQKRYSEAAPLYERALVIWENALGPDHSDVGIALHNLANLHRNQGEHGLARPLYERSLAIWEQALGSEHLFVGISLREQAVSAGGQREFARAETLFKRSLSVLEAAVGAEHPQTNETREQLAAMLRATGREEQADRLE